MPNTRELMRAIIAKRAADKQTANFTYNQQNNQVSNNTTNHINVNYSPRHTKKQKTEPTFDFARAGRVHITVKQAMTFEANAALRKMVVSDDRYININYKAFCLARTKLSSEGKVIENTVNLLSTVFDTAAALEENQPLFNALADWYATPPPQKNPGEETATAQGPSISASEIFVMLFLDDPYLLHCFFPTEKQNALIEKHKRSFQTICPLCHIKAGIFDDVLHPHIIKDSPSNASKMGFHNFDQHDIIAHLQKPRKQENKNKPFQHHTVQLHQYLYSVYTMLQTEYHDKFQAAITADYKLAFPDQEPLQIPPALQTEHDKHVIDALAADDTPDMQLPTLS